MYEARALLEEREGDEVKAMKILQEPRFVAIFHMFLERLFERREGLEA